MRKPTLHRLLSLLLACVLLAQAAVGVAGWHVDFPLVAHDHPSLHCAVLEQHHATHHLAAGEQDTVGAHQHHHCCHTLQASIPCVSLMLPPAESVIPILVFSPATYRDPLAELLIRPPIA